MDGENPTHSVVNRELKYLALKNAEGANGPPECIAARSLKYRKEHN